MRHANLYIPIHNSGSKVHDMMELPDRMFHHLWTTGPFLIYKWGPSENISTAIPSTAATTHSSDRPSRRTRIRDFDKSESLYLPIHSTHHGPLHHIQIKMTMTSYSSHNHTHIARKRKGYKSDRRTPAPRPSSDTLVNLKVSSGLAWLQAAGSSAVTAPRARRLPSFPLSESLPLDPPPAFPNTPGQPAPSL